MVKKSNKSFYTLAQKVLQENKKPMHYMDITKEILKIKETKGKTPERTVMAVILRDKHNVFTSVGEGIFGLSSFQDNQKSTA
jgi:DNA-directed RNA polymerase delta subunit